MERMRLCRVKSCGCEQGGQLRVSRVCERMNLDGLQLSSKR